MKQASISPPKPIGVNHARRSALYVLALWGKYLPVNTTGEETLPQLENDEIILPIIWSEHRNAYLHYRAAAAHIAAHVAYGLSPYEAGDLTSRQLAIIGLIEDARVENLAIRHNPGLRNLWLSFCPDQLPQTLDFPTLTQRLAKALLMPSAQDDNAWVTKGIALFHENPMQWRDPEFARELGLRLAHDLGQMRISMNDSQVFQVLTYRDDNRHLWLQTEEGRTSDMAEPGESATFSDGIFLSESDKGRILELADTAGNDEIPDLHRIQETSEEEAVLEYFKSAEATASGEHTYPEWNYQLELFRNDWCTVREWPLHIGSTQWIRSVIHEQRAVLHRMQRIANAIHLEKVQRMPRQQDGDELDINAVVQAVTDVRNGQEPDLRLHYRVRPLHDRGLASLVLLDLSESCNDRVPETGQTIVELTRQASLLIGHALDALDENFAIHGFASRGRHDVGYYRIKDFSDHFDDDAMKRIAGLRGAYSTRLGTALRHATAELQAQEEQRKLLLVVTDGSPSDIDVYDPTYLSSDAQQAVQEALRAGVVVFCLCLDASAQAEVTRIFGTRRFRILDHVTKLPVVLPEILLSLVRHY